MTRIFSKGDSVFYAVPGAAPIQGTVTDTNMLEGGRTVVIDFGPGMNRHYYVEPSYSSWITLASEWNRFDLDDVDI